MKKLTMKNFGTMLATGSAVLALSAVMAAPATSGSASHGAPAHKQSASKPGGHGGAHWGYSGATGPGNWGDLAVDYHACKTGMRQSPIDIARAEGQTAKPIRFDYKPTPLSVTNNGHTVQVNYTPGSSVTIGDRTYQLLQFHFHTPSEHSVNGKRSAMELHFVHKNEAGQLAVVGVMMQDGAENLALRTIWQHMPTRMGQTGKPANVTVNGRDLLPLDTSYYRYMGSLTTPPCSEGVNWHVMRQAVTVSAPQTRKFADAVGENARPIQAMNSRLLLAPAGTH